MVTNRYTKVFLVIAVAIAAAVGVSTPSAFSEDNRFLDRNSNFANGSNNGMGTPDYSRSYGIGGVIRRQQPPPGPRPIIDMSTGASAGGILGCSGLDIGAAVGNQLGGLNISNISKEIAGAVQTKLFNAALETLFSNPQVASIMDNLRAVAHARVSMLQKKCNANEIYADVTNKRLRSEAIQKCVQERQNMEICQDPAIIGEYLGEVLDSDRWNKDLRNQLCDSEEDGNCDWTLLLPNKKTRVDGISPTSTPAGSPISVGPITIDTSLPFGSSTPAPSSGATTGSTTGSSGSSSTGGTDGSTPPVAAGDEETPPAITVEDVVTMATQIASEDLIERIQDAETFINMFGYSDTKTAALYNQMGIPPELQDRYNALSNSNPDVKGALLYNMHDYQKNSVCQYGAGSSGIASDISSITSPEEKALDADLPAPPVDNTPSPSPSPSPSPAPTPSASSGKPVFPVSGATIGNANITSLFGPRSRPCKGCSSFHKGLDLGYGTGTGLVSSIDGIVQQARKASCGGNQVGISNGATNILYLHMNGFAPGIRPGVPIRSGVKIGTVGNTGSCTTGPHLHFVVMNNGAHVDPLPWLGGDDDSIAGALASTDKHGTRSMAIAKTSLPPNDPFVIEMHKEMAKLGSRIASTASCIINKTLHPQTYVEMAMLSGTAGIINPNEAVNKSGEAPIFASGDKGAFITGMSQMVGYDAAISVYNSTIVEMTVSLASKSSDGESGMNKPLLNYAKGQLAFLKLRRSVLITSYESQCQVAKRIARMADTRSSSSTKGYNQVANVPMNCSKYDHLTSDGIADLAKIFTETDEVVDTTAQESK